MLQNPRRIKTVKSSKPLTKKEEPKKELPKVKPNKMKKGSC